MPKLLNCIVPGCKSSRHYTLSDDAADSVTFFSFPKKYSRRKLWINALPRGYWQPQKSSRICMLHFKESEIIRGKPGRLAHSAVPSIFPSLPDLPKPNSLTQNVLIKTEQLEDNVRDFENFCENFETKLQLDRWYFLKTADNVILYLVEENETTICSFKVRISVCSDFFVRVFLTNSELSSKDLNWILPFDKKLTLWSQLNCIMSQYETNETIPEEQDIYEQNFSVDNKKIKLFKEDTNDTIPEELDIYEQNIFVDNKKIKLIKADTDQTISDQEISNEGITNQFICDEQYLIKQLKMN